MTTTDIHQHSIQNICWQNVNKRTLFKKHTAQKATLQKIYQWSNHFTSFLSPTSIKMNPEPTGPCVKHWNSSTQRIKTGSGFLVTHGISLHSWDGETQWLASGLPGEVILSGSSLYFCRNRYTGLEREQTHCPDTPPIHKIPRSTGTEQIRATPGRCPGLRGFGFTIRRFCLKSDRASYTFWVIPQWGHTVPQGHAVLSDISRPSQNTDRSTWQHTGVQN